MTAAEPSGDNFASLNVGGVHELVQAINGVACGAPPLTGMQASKRPGKK